MRKRSERTRGARPPTRADVTHLRRLLDEEERPAWKIKRLKEWAKQKRGLSAKVRNIIMGLDDELPAEVALAKIEVIYDMIMAEAEEA